MGMFWACSGIDLEVTKGKDGEKIKRIFQVAGLELAPGLDRLFRLARTGIYT